VRQWAAIESWAAAGLLAALRAMMREDSEGTPLLRRRSDLPDGWNDSLNHEIAGALAMGPASAGNLAGRPTGRTPRPNRVAELANRQAGRAKLHHLDGGPQRPRFRRRLHRRKISA
jgi:hypothetical protein